MVREVRLSTTDLIGKPVTFEGREIGHVANVQGDTVICAIDSDIVAHRIRGGQTTLSLEVIDR